MGDSTPVAHPRGCQQLLIDGLLKSSCSTIADKSKLVFEAFDTDKDGSISMREFHIFLSVVFTGDDRSGLVADISEHVFSLFDADHDGALNCAEFRNLWCSEWMRAVLNPVSALLIVDVQNDFIDGSLALKNCPAGQDGADVVPIINCMLDKHALQFKLVVCTQDWHPSNHCSFAENVGLRKVSSNSKISAANAKAFDVVTYDGPPETEQKLWPAHCVQGSWGAAIHSALKVPDNAIFVQKGVKPDIDCYSGFGNLPCNYRTELSGLLRSHDITDVFVCGLASDICVFETLLDAVHLGFRTVFVENAARGVSPEAISSTRQTFIGRNGLIVNSDEVGDLQSARNRPLLLGWQRLANMPDKYGKLPFVDASVKLPIILKSSAAAAGCAVNGR